MAKVRAKAVKPAKVTKKKARTKKKVEPTKSTSESRPKKAGDSEKVFDVTRPGASMPSASARPVIVTSRPLASDPMVKAGDTLSDDKTGDSAMAARAKKVVIQPLNTDLVVDDAVDDVSEQDEQVDIKPTIEVADTPESESQQSKPEEKKAESDDTEEISELASQAAAKGEAAKEAEKAAQRAAEAEKIIESKKYFVPINTVKKRQAMRAFWIFVTIVVLVIGAVAAIDAELVDIGIELPFDYL